MREIPSLQTLCLRSVGSHSCSAEAVFCQASDGSLRTGSRLLRSFAARPTRITAPQKKTKSKQDETNDDKDDTMRRIPLPRTACIGPGSTRRVQANEVDLHHPVIACLDGAPPADDNDDADDSSNAANPQLVMWHGNSALDTLQSYIDSLVEMGRMDDVRLGRHFWEEWKVAIMLQASSNGGKGDTAGTSDAAAVPTPSKKRQKRQATPASSKIVVPASLGALSLHNCVVGEETFERMREADLGPYLAVVDLTGVGGLTDDLMRRVLPTFANLRQLSLKNCRRITVQTIQTLVDHVVHLETLDVGGAYNVRCQQLINAVLPNKLPRLVSLHASGLGWDDDALSSLVRGRDHWTQLSLSFSTNLTQASALKSSLSQVADSLTSLALAFCETLMDNAALGLLGRNLPNIISLDVRGNPQLNTMTGWYDGRVSADLPAQNLTVLGRYSGLTDASVDETRRQHPVEARDLLVVLDGGGMGAGITRYDASETKSAGSTPSVE
jgi:hypothetical protein